THPSVRIKGTESNFQPERCVDSTCTDPIFHMHCPLCIKSDIYHDPVILKAHFRVKHVDKGIDFAGLKILRCCDHCDIVGIIKGEKKFKGAHWHCYRCRNGFNRRDEAIKHYKTHFRNPQTTFQIQIAQQTPLPIHSALTQAVMSTSLSQGQSLLASPSGQVSLTSHKAADGTIGVSVAANETVHSSEAQGQHIMIIQEDPLDRGEETYTTQVITSEGVNLEEEKEHDISSSPSNGYEDLEQQASHQNSNNRFEELQQKYRELLVEKLTGEQNMKTEIQQLKQQVVSLEVEVDALQKREQQLLRQISVPLDKNIEKLLSQLESQHRDLLHQQLLEIKRSYTAKVNSEQLTNIQSESESENQSQIQDENNCGVELVNVENENTENGILTQIDQDLAKDIQNMDDTVGNKIQASDLGQNDNATIVNVKCGQDGSEPYVVCIEYADLPGTKPNAYKVTSSGLEMETESESDLTCSSMEPLTKRLKTS
ncbi:hypothetical protein FSP39_012162, partial [Pinctada imbricata]